MDEEMDHHGTDPPFRERIKAALVYLRRLEIESAYVAPQGHT
jgi:hypothetical protein